MSCDRTTCPQELVASFANLNKNRHFDVGIHLAFSCICVMKQSVFGCRHCAGLPVIF